MAQEIVAQKIIVVDGIPLINRGGKPYFDTAALRVQLSRARTSNRCKGYGMLVALCGLTATEPINGNQGVTAALDMSPCDHRTIGNCPVVRKRDALAEQARQLRGQRKGAVTS